MRVLYLGSGRSVHAVRWVRAIAGRGHDVHFVTQHAPAEAVPECAGVDVLPVGSRLGYVLNVGALRRIARRLAPDLVHVNYAGGYGTLARLAAMRAPVVLTVYGSDVLLVPRRGGWRRAVIIGNLRAARVITSSSRAMADAVTSLAPSAHVVLVPFGVDTGTFRPGRPPDARTPPVIGTVKGLDPVYGIDLLLRAFAAVRSSGRAARLVIAGSGPAERELRRLADALGVAADVTFLGNVPHGEVPGLLTTFSVYVALSRSESFGVGVAEASACGVPVVAARVGGLPEIVRDGLTGFLVPPEDAPAAAAAIARLLADPRQAAAMGAAGRSLVQERYEWRSCVDAMLDAYACARRSPDGPAAGARPRFGDDGKLRSSRFSS